jgi:hypothetical protein
MMHDDERSSRASEQSKANHNGGVCVTKHVKLTESRSEKQTDRQTHISSVYTL